MIWLQEVTNWFSEWKKEHLRNNWLLTEIYKDSVSNQRSMRKSELRQITDLFFRVLCTCISSAAAFLFLSAPATPDTCSTSCTSSCTSCTTSCTSSHLHLHAHAHAAYQPAWYLPAYLPAYLFAHLPANLPAHLLPAHLHICIVWFAPAAPPLYLSSTSLQGTCSTSVPPYLSTSAGCMQHLQHPCTTSDHLSSDPLILCLSNLWLYNRVLCHLYRR